MRETGKAPKVMLDRQLYRCLSLRCSRPSATGPWSLETPVQPGPKTQSSYLEVTGRLCGKGISSSLEGFPSCLTA